MHELTVGGSFWQILDVVLLESQIPNLRLIRDETS